MQELSQQKSSFWRKTVARIWSSLTPWLDHHLEVRFFKILAEDGQHAHLLELK